MMLLWHGLALDIEDPPFRVRHAEIDNSRDFAALLDEYDMLRPDPLLITEWVAQHFIFKLERDYRARKRA